MTEVILKPITEYYPPKPTNKEEDETVYLVHNITGHLFFMTGTEIMMDMAYGCFIDKYCEIPEVRLANWQKYKDLYDRAKELIKRLIKATYGEGWNYSLQVKVEAEQFLKESE